MHFPAHHGEARRYRSALDSDLHRWKFQQPSHMQHARETVLHRHIPELCDPFLQQGTGIFPVCV